MLENENVSETQLLPISIFFNDDLSAFESITKYLKEEKNLRYSEIAKILNRDQRTIWCTYSKAKKKMQERLICSSEITIPVSYVSKRNLSVLETITTYCKEELALSFNKISTLLKRDYRTIWTVYSRAQKKRRLNAAG